MRKATNRRVNHDFLRARVEKIEALGYKKQRWVEFSEVMLSYGFVVELYEARKTLSKYLTVIHQGKRFKVRFSNHRPIRRREEAGDCDFFVGITNLRTTNTEQAIAATLEYFGVEKRDNTHLLKTPIMQ